MNERLLGIVVLHRNTFSLIFATILIDILLVAQDTGHSSICLYLALLVHMMVFSSEVLVYNLKKYCSTVLQ